MMDPVDVTTPEVVINTSDLDVIHLYVTNDDEGVVVDNDAHALVDLDRLSFSLAGHVQSGYARTVRRRHVHQNPAVRGRHVLLDMPEFATA